MCHICRRIIKYAISSALVLIVQIFLISCGQQSPGSSFSDASNPLQKVSTAGLIEIVLSHSFYWEMQSRNTVQAGFNAITYKASIQELLKRKDAGTELLARYRGMNYIVKNNFKRGERSELDYELQEKLCEMEVMLAQYSIINNLTKTQRLDLLKAALAKYQEERLRAR